MGVFDMIALAVVVGCTAGVLTKWLETRKNAPDTDAIGKMLDERLTRLDDLDERIRVLERIVTDRRGRLAEQFDELERHG